MTIRLYNTFTPIVQDVIADGPTDSPHRYGGGRLCIWHPKDPPERGWVHQDGRLQLIIHARVHLLKEAWWREERVRISEALPRDSARSGHVRGSDDDRAVRRGRRQVQAARREDPRGRRRLYARVLGGRWCGADAQMNVSDIDFAPLEDYEQGYLTAVAADVPAWKFWRGREPWG